MEKLEWKSFPDLKTAEALEAYLADRPLNHTGFYHYTKAENLQKILEGNCFLLSRPESCNDKKEGGEPSRPEELDGQFRFLLCFSTGVNEVLPMWFLYSGIDGRGARLKLTKYGVSTILQRGKYSLVKMNKNGKLNGRFSLPLTPGKDFVCEFRDVLYAKHDPRGDTYCLKYNNMTNFGMPAEEYEAYRRMHPFFEKDVIWYYEKETRLLITLTPEFAEKHNLDGKTDYRVKLDFGSVTRLKKEVTFAPGVQKNELVEEAGKYSCIEALRKKSGRFVCCSEYAGQLDFKLCKDCRHSFEKKGR